jgi:hypothetical protein
VDGADLTILLGEWGGPGKADFDGTGAVELGMSRLILPQLEHMHLLLRA